MGTSTFQPGDFVFPTAINAFKELHSTICEFVTRHLGLGFKQPTAYGTSFFGKVDNSVLKVVFIDSVSDMLVCRSGFNEDLPPLVLDPLFVTLVARPVFQLGDKVRLRKDRILYGHKTVGAGTICTVRTINLPHKYVVETEYKDIQTDIFTASEEDLCTEEEWKAIIKPTETKPMSASYRLSFYALKKGRDRPATMILQLCANKLVEGVDLEPYLVGDEVSFPIGVDGLFGTNTFKVAKAIQRFEGYADGEVDGVFGKGSWRKLTPHLGDWKPPLYLRIAECQCTLESGTDGFGYYGMIQQEGWYNYGIWNVNRGSARKLLLMGGADHLTGKIESNPEEVAAWFRSKPGRDTQVGSYVLNEILKPSIRNLVRAGFKLKNFGIEDIDAIDNIGQFPETLDPIYERLLLVSCDITVNSGAGGFFFQKSPRQWQSRGELAWPDFLPDREACKRIFSEEFGKPIPDDYTYVTADSSEPYRKAITRCLWGLCENDEQRICIIGEIQGRCIVDAWRDAILRRRRAVAWKNGHVAQGSQYYAREHFGIGVEPGDKL